MNSKLQLIGHKATIFLFTSVILTGLRWTAVAQTDTTYKIVDTGQIRCYNNSTEITAPSPGQSFYGQDANYPGNTASYTDNGDGTVTDLVTGLMWQKSPDRNGDGAINYADKLFFDEALDSAASFNLAGYNDWRLPTIKELYSLIMFYGVDLNPQATEGTIPFIDTGYFDFAYGDLGAGERIIDAQYASSTIYVGSTMSGNRTMFGVNFADGRIKGYPADSAIGKKYYVQYVRGNTAYGTNEFVDNGDGTITDNATGLMWMKNDNGAGVLWENGLSYAEDFEYAGQTDWRLPNAKELQSIVDYTRSPATTNSAAIDTMFNCTSIANEAGETDYPFYWTSTTHSSQVPSNGPDADYVCFGRAMGYVPPLGGWIDVHGAGAQRSDPKVGNPDDFPFGRGPQGDAVRIYNYVRCVRGGSVTNCLSKPGDANASGTYTLADAITIFNYVFNKPGCAPLPLCWLSGLLCRGDWNGSGTVTLEDAIRAVNYIFNKPGGPWNALPVGVCCLP